MIVNFEDVSGATLDRLFDVCICGSGPAGMTLAIKLASMKKSVLLLEAGDITWTEESQKVYQGKNVGLDYFPPDISRLRYFGGTSNHWGGWCRTLDAHDFDVRDYIEHSGWPITKLDIDPFLADAKQILDVENPKETPDYLGLDESDTDLKKVKFESSGPSQNGWPQMPTHIGEKYGEQVRLSDNILCLLNANLVDIILNDSFKAVDTFVVVGYSGKSISVRAKRYVLCLGGIENARMLLNANKQMAFGIGNENDLVGRFFMEHPTNTVADFLVNHENPFVQSLTKLAELPRSFYAPSGGFMEANKLTNFCVRVFPSSQFKYESLTFTERLKKTICTSDTLYSVAKEFKDKLWCYDGRIRVSCEQIPNPSSQIKLGNNIDRFGNRRVEINWQISPIDKLSIQQATIITGKIFAEKNIGRLRVRNWVLDPAIRLPTTMEDEVGGFHHMGTTRMADSPRKGVINKNLQVFGIGNLYVGGSSVFPTCGYSNPTLTIVQLSLRLAEHLNNELTAT